MNKAMQNSFRPGHTEIMYKNMKFLITDKPNDATLEDYICELKKRKVTDVVRVCEADYSTLPLLNSNIKVHDWFFEDGTLPPPQIIADWFDLLLTRFRSQTSKNKEKSPDQESDLPCIAVHCVAGLGRAPVLVALALIELGMKFEDAVELIRTRRRGAINANQLNFLADYKAKGKLKHSTIVSSTSSTSKCLIT